MNPETPVFLPVWCDLAFSGVLPYLDPFPLLLPLPLPGVGAFPRLPRALYFPSLPPSDFPLYRLRHGARGPPGRADRLSDLPGAPGTIFLQAAQAAPLGIYGNMVGGAFITPLYGKNYPPLWKKLPPFIYRREKITPLLSAQKGGAWPPSVRFCLWITLAGYSSGAQSAASFTSHSAKSGGVRSRCALLMPSTVREAGCKLIGKAGNARGDAPTT